MENVKKNTFKFFVFYAIYFMGTVVYNNFIPLYYKECGFNESQIGFISSIGPAATMVSMLVIGRVADRMKNMNILISGLLFISGGITYLYTLNKSYIYMLVLAFTYVFFNAPILQLNDVVAVNYSLRTGAPYNKIRLGGSLGYALMSLLCGYLVARGAELMFFAAIAIFAVSGFIVLTLPHPQKDDEEKGAKKEKVSYFKLFTPAILLLLVANVFTYLPPFYFNTFYLINLKAHGGSEYLMGISIFYEVMCELPFFIFAGRLSNRFSSRTMIAVSCGFTCARYMLTGLLTSPTLIVLVNGLNGGCHIVVNYFTCIYLQRHVAPSLKASAQTLIGLFTYGIAKFCSNFFGGMASSAFGIPTCFTVLGAAAGVAGLIYYFGQGRLEAREKLNEKAEVL